jgi:hypothetical protein
MKKQYNPMNQNEQDNKPEMTAISEAMSTILDDSHYRNEYYREACFEHLKILRDIRDSEKEKCAEFAKHFLHQYLRWRDMPGTSPLSEPDPKIVFDDFFIKTDHNGKVDKSQKKYGTYE